MFRSLIKVNNDGLIITQNDEIVFFNDQMVQIFDVPFIPLETQSINSNDEASLSNQFNTPTVKINCEID